MQRFILNRRQMLGGLAAGAGLSLLGPMGRASAAVSEIVWATWDSNGHPEYVTAFEKATGTKVKLSFLSSEDAQFAALKTGAASDWDVVNPSLNQARRYIKAGELMPLDLAKVPNLAHMYDVFKATEKVKGEDGQTYAIPYLWGLNPIVYRSDIHTEEPTYSTLFDPKFKGQLAMRDYALESIAIAALHIGIPRERAFLLTSDELAEVKKALIAQKPLLRTYWQTIGDLTNLIATGEVTAAFSWRVPYDALKDKMKVAMAKPKAGIMGWCDCFAIPASLPEEKVETAYKFADYLLGADYASTIAEIGNYATTSSIIRDKLTPEKQEAIFVDDLSVMQNFMWPEAPENYSEWLKVWNEVKAA
ncbi:spermidine/putrescine transport system substrate-binding protein [Pleomorphomonas diazotrophica]|nr:extracellular solute-binding protein [Pleomorphomonas diazotrophica]SFM69975.1 spermidine/putrescine transport system substrate-binding protein [Pleomorphomonas diazotrophica]